jgi:hypothetical protein
VALLALAPSVSACRGASSPAAPPRATGLGAGELDDIDIDAESERDVPLARWTPTRIGSWKRATIRKLS